MTDIDVKTGLPKIPEGYFWRVKRSIHPFAVVQLRKRSWFGSRVVGESTRYRSDLNPETVLQSACFILERDKPFNKPETDLYGDYPPKKLEDVK